MSAVEPRKGLRFLHARRITGSPKAGTAQPVECVVTRVTATSVYFKATEDGQPVGVPSVISRPRFDEVVGSIVETGAAR